MKMIAIRRVRRKKKITNHPESRKRYLLINLGSVWGFACAEKTYKIKYEWPSGQLNVILSWLYARPQDTHRYN